MRTSSSVGGLGRIRDGRNPLDNVNIHHRRYSMLLRFIPSIRKMFIDATEAGFGPANLVESGPASKWSEKRNGNF